MKRLLMIMILALIPAAVAQLTPDVHQFYGDVTGAIPGMRIDVLVNPAPANPVFTFIDANNRYGYSPLLLVPVTSTSAIAEFRIANQTASAKQTLQKYTATKLDLIYSYTLPSHCTNGIFEPTLGETDMDCGGPCPGCLNGLECKIGTDCASGLCINGMCYPAHCANTLFDWWYGETDVDCGGLCPQCGIGLDCVDDSDCASGNCVNGTCRQPYNHCTNGIKDVDETDIDCGGSCPKCNNGDDCLANKDCRSGYCGNGKCRSRPVVSGGGGGGGGGGGLYLPWIKAEEETTTGMMCKGDWQCTEWGACTPEELKYRECTWIPGEETPGCTLRPAAPMTMEVCKYIPQVLETCYDNIQNQGEEGIDCGGPCAPCYIPIEVPAEEPKRTPWIILGVMLIAIILGAVAWMVLRPPKITDAGSYVRSAVARGFTQKEVAEKLKEAGYTQEQIRRAIK